MGKLFPHPVGVFRTIPKPPKSRVIQKIDFSEKRPYLVISIFFHRRLVIRCSCIFAEVLWPVSDREDYHCSSSMRQGHYDSASALFQINMGPPGRLIGSIYIGLPTVDGKIWVLLDIAVFLKNQFLAISSNILISGISGPGVGNPIYILPINRPGGPILC